MDVFSVYIVSLADMPLLQTHIFSCPHWGILKSRQCSMYKTYKSAYSYCFPSLLKWRCWPTVSREGGAFCSDSFPLNQLAAASQTQCTLRSKRSTSRLQKRQGRAQPALPAELLQSVMSAPIFLLTQHTTLSGDTPCL